VRSGRAAQVRCAARSGRPPGHVVARPGMRARAGTETRESSSRRRRSRRRLLPGSRRARTRRSARPVRRVGVRYLASATDIESRAGPFCDGRSIDERHPADRPAVVPLRHGEGLQSDLKPICARAAATSASCRPSTGRWPCGASAARDRFHLRHRLLEPHPGYTTRTGFNSVHGRSLPIARASSWPTPISWCCCGRGDGDGFSIGGATWPMRSGATSTSHYIVMDNQIYGLTRPVVSDVAAGPLDGVRRPLGSMESR